MATNSTEEFFEITDLSGGVQRKSTIFMQKENQVDLSINATYGRIGGFEKSLGYDQLGNTITSSSSSTTTSTSTTTSSSSTSSSTTSSSSTSSSTTSTSTSSSTTSSSSTTTMA